MFCGECGHRWEPDEIATARFCAECGAPREDLPPAAAPSPAPSLAPTPAASFASSSLTSSFGPGPATGAAPSSLPQTPSYGADPAFSSSSLGSFYGSAPASSSGASAGIPAYSSASTAPTTSSAYSSPSTGSFYGSAALSSAGASPGVSSYSSTAPPAASAYPASASPSFLPPPAPSACPQCFVPFADEDGAFCGECGHPRPPKAAAESEDDGDLFGLASTTSAAPAAATSSSAYSPYGSSAASSAGSAAAASPSPFAASVSAPYNPPAYGTAPTPSYPAPQPSIPPPAPEEPAEPPAAVSLDASAPSISSVSSLLANLSVGTKVDGEREEPNGSGAGVRIRRVVRARNMDSLSTRLEISRAVERNRTQPAERVDGYNVTKVNDTITVVHNERAELLEERYYDERTMPDDGEWLQILRKNRQNGSKFTDPQFPPDETSLFRDPSRKVYPHLGELVHKWKRVSDFFNETAYVEVTMLDDERGLVCSMAIKSQAEAETILGVLRADPAPVDPRFLQTAKDAVATGLSGRKRDHLLLLTKNMIVHMSEFVQDGMQRFELMWGKSLLDRYKPLAFAGVGEGAGYRVDGSEAGLVSRVAVLVPIQFEAQGTCLFDRSRESAAASAASGVGVGPGEVRVGRLADAYLFGALSILSTSPTALAQVFPLLSDDLVRSDRVEPGSPFPTEQQYNEEGVYAVRFWRNNRSRVVVVDDLIPCSQYGKPVFGAFTGSNAKFEMWALLVEKAYAKLHGGYEAIVGGQEAYALQDLYGGVPVSYRLQERCSSEEAAWQALSSALQAGSLVGCSNDADADLPAGIRRSDAYGVMKLVELEFQGQAVRLVQLRNSWGLGAPQQPAKWAGAWSNQDPRWHSFSRAQKVECGFQFREDGTYWMDLGAFYCCFTRVIESRNLYNFRSVPDGVGNPVSPSLSIHLISGEWNGITSGGRDAMHLNPQYQVFAPADCTLSAHLEQPDRRVKMELEYPSYVAPLVLKNGERARRKIDLSSDVVATGTFISNRSCLLEVALGGAEARSPGAPFVVIPATYDGHLPHPLGFNLTLFSSAPTAVLPVSDTASLPVCCVCQRALSGTFRTFTHSSSSGSSTDPPQVDRVCQGACVEAYRERNTPVCADCGERIQAVEGRFSGRMFTLPDGSALHAECIDAYQIRTSDKCVHCGDAIAAIPGRFDGRYYEIRGGKCHSECMEAFQASTAERCVHCGEPVLQVPGRFDGRFYKIEGGRLVHFECWDKYQAAIAPKCVHCAQPILQVPGRFDGRFYELTAAGGGGKVHFECWDNYQTLASARR